MQFGSCHTPIFLPVIAATVSQKTRNSSLDPDRLEPDLRELINLDGLNKIEEPRNRFHDLPELEPEGAENFQHQYDVREYLSHVKDSYRDPEYIYFSKSSSGSLNCNANSRSRSHAYDLGDSHLLDDENTDLDKIPSLECEMTDTKLNELD